MSEIEAATVVQERYAHAVDVFQEAVRKALENTLPDENLGVAFNNFGQNLQQAVRDYLIETVKKVAVDRITQELLEYAHEQIASIDEAVQQYIKGAISFEEFTAIVDAGMSQIASATGVVEDPINRLSQALNYLSGNAITAVGDINAAAQSIENFDISGIKAAIGGLSSSLSSAISGVANSLMPKLTNIASGGVALPHSTQSTQWSAGGASINASGILPHFATGGIITKPTLGLLGESGPEAVLPLSSMAETFSKFIFSDFSAKPKQQKIDDARTTEDQQITLNAIARNTKLLLDAFERLSPDGDALMVTTA